MIHAHNRRNTFETCVCLLVYVAYAYSCLPLVFNFMVKCPVAHSFHTALPVDAGLVLSVVDAHRNQKDEREGGERENHLSEAGQNFDSN